MYPSALLEVSIYPRPPVNDALCLYIIRQQPPFALSLCGVMVNACCPPSTNIPLGFYFQDIAGGSYPMAKNGSKGNDHYLRRHPPTKGLFLHFGCGLRSQDICRVLDSNPCRYKQCHNDPILPPQIAECLRTRGRKHQRTVIVDPIGHNRLRSWCLQVHPFPCSHPGGRFTAARP